MQTILANPTYILIALAWAAFLLYWVISAARGKQAQKMRNWALTSLMVAAVLVLFLILRQGTFPDIFNAVLWRGTLAAEIAADAVVLMGLIVLIWARRTLGSSWSANVATKQDHKLVQSGPYRYVRHPIYSGFLGMVLGTAIAYGHLVGIIILAMCTAGFYLKAMQEESVLTKQYPYEYTKYKAKTKALIPYLL